MTDKVGCTPGVSHASTCYSATYSPVGSFSCIDGSSTVTSPLRQFARGVGFGGLEHRQCPTNSVNMFCKWWALVNINVPFCNSHSSSELGLVGISHSRVGSCEVYEGSMSLYGHLI